MCTYVHVLCSITSTSPVSRCSFPERASWGRQVTASDGHHRHCESWWPQQWRAPCGISVPAEQSLPELNITTRPFGARDPPLDGWWVAWAAPSPGWQRAALSCTGPWGNCVCLGWLKRAAGHSLQSMAYNQLPALRGQISQPVLPAKPCSSAKPSEVAAAALTAAGTGPAAAHPPASMD